MLGRIEHFFRRLQRRFDRSEWAIPLLRLPVAKNTANQPGLILIQIDGLARDQMEQAMATGRLPFLRSLIQRQHYRTHTFYSGLPSSTPAVQAELHYGVPTAVPAFSFLDRPSQSIFTMFNPDCAKQIERQLKTQGKGLLEGGSSWSNIYCGGASEEESHFCTASLGLGNVFRARPLIRLLTFPLIHFASLLRLVSLLLIEWCIAWKELIRGVLKGESFFKELTFIFARVFVSIGLREIVTIGTKIDAARGLPIIHLNFLGYDEQAHRRGPSSRFAHWSLKGIDRSIKGIYRTATRSARRDYQVWVFSDHGQEATRSYAEIHGKELEDVIRGILQSTPASRSAQLRSQQRLSRIQLSGRRRLERLQALQKLSDVEKESFSLAAMGPVGHLYFSQPRSLEEKKEIARALVTEGDIPLLLLSLESGEVMYFRTDSCGIFDATADFSFSTDLDLNQAILTDCIALCHSGLAGDLLLLGWSPDQDPISFAEERGAHAGPGSAETRGFALLPAATRLPADVATFIRPLQLRQAALHFLQRQSLLPRQPVRSHSAQPASLHVMTYNVHGCRGMDGRISPYRIARIIRQHDPDIVALQELDSDRPRSHSHNQSEMIAEELGLHYYFLPTLIDGDEKYGHAILSRYPAEIVRAGLLQPAQIPPTSKWAEPRGVLWIKIMLGERPLHVLNTHFGLSRRERTWQTQALISKQWLGAIPTTDAVILCGDFNMLAGGPNYQVLTRQLQDTHIAATGALSTFASFRPFVRLDYIFASPNLTPLSIKVPRNHLTRIGSDHLPLIAEVALPHSSD